MPRVLVCEDDPAIGALMLAVLRRYGMDGVWVRGGNAALELLRDSPYDAVVLDLMMPEGSGFDVLNWMRDHAPSQLARVIVVTAAASARRSGVPEQVCSFLLKPFEVTEFVDAVTACLAAPPPPRQPRRTERED